jgi:hypothetical protein
MESAKSVQTLIVASPLNLKGVKAMFYVWEPGFDPAQVLWKGAFTIFFPNLFVEYMKMLGTIATKIGSVLGELPKLSKIPSRRILVTI